MDEKGAETRGEECRLSCPLCWTLKAAHEMRASLKRTLPEEFWQHHAAARRECLLALRSLVDAALAGNQSAPARKATRIKVE